MTQHLASEASTTHRVAIVVNNKVVHLDRARATGLQIKEAAIAQAVDIQLDFQLAVLHGDGKRKIIGDSDLVHLHEHEKFVATAGDDNS